MRKYEEFIMIIGKDTLDKEEKINNRKDKKQKRISEERRKWSESY